VRATARCLIIAVTIASWIAVSNHCTIRALETKTASTQSACPFHSKPARPKSQPSTIECCKVLRAVCKTHAKVLAPAIVDFVHVDLDFEHGTVFAPLETSFVSATLDTGPPGKTSFAELNRSMRAHAPPVGA
jgi:hypothetical protein